MDSGFERIKSAIFERHGSPCRIEFQAVSENASCFLSEDPIAWQIELDKCPGNIVVRLRKREGWPPEGGLMGTKADRWPGAFRVMRVISGS